MFLFIFAIIIFLIGIFLIVVPVADEDFKFAFKVGGIASILFGIVFFICSFIKTVPTGSTGIVTTFGRVESYTYEAGFHMTAPWHKVTCMDNRTQAQTLEMLAFSSDIQEVNVVYTINFQINKSNAQEIYKTIGMDYYNVVVLPRANEAVKAVIAKYNAESLVASRGNLSGEIEEVLSVKLAESNIELVSTALESIDFTDTFTNAVEAKVKAEQDKLTAKANADKEIVEAEAAAEKKRIEAQATADANKIAAEMDAEIAKIAADSAEYQGQKDAAIMSNIGKMLKDYPELIDYYYATNWNGKLPETMLGDSDVLFSIGK